MTYCIGTGQAEHLTTYKSFIDNYNDADPACTLRDKRSISSIIIITNHIATHWEISKQLEPTSVTTSAESCSADK
eukprot:8273288-Ditylum_brightwellii.AAC.1